MAIEYTKGGDLIRPGAGVPPLVTPPPIEVIGGRHPCPRFERSPTLEISLIEGRGTARMISPSIRNRRMAQSLPCCSSIGPVSCREQRWWCRRAGDDGGVEEQVSFLPVEVILASRSKSQVEVISTSQRFF
ncbi:hypothetical protein CRG98_006764 [Punica granatum]|uniref:Uncharacterized protein n=1 Tax=Punica granatum TaxID=22663 RepID=A0A2I0KWL0_PUNGR|nr:hypothetical protein CRG98_006764 [Punica granatum]